VETPVGADSSARPPHLARQLKIGPDTVFRRADVTLNAVPTLDHQVLQALLDLRSAALTVGAA
jgi:hypothetical protein